MPLIPISRAAVGVSTKTGTLRLLISSHIKLWQLYEDWMKRLDGANCLSLMPHVDRPYDQGISALKSTVMSRCRASSMTLTWGGLDLARHARVVAWHSIRSSRPILPIAGATYSSGNALSDAWRRLPANTLKLD